MVTNRGFSYKRPDNGVVEEYPETGIQTPNGTLPGVVLPSALVVASDAPAEVIAQAKIAKIIYGSLIQICDGINDDIEINTALAETGIIILTSGNYNCGASLIPNGNTYNNIIRGKGVNATFIKTISGGFGSSLMHWSSTSVVNGRMIIEDLTFEGQNGSNGTLIDLHQTETSAQLSINRVTFFNHNTGYVLDLSGCDDTLLQQTYAYSDASGAGSQVKIYNPYGDIRDTKSIWGGADIQCQTATLIGTGLTSGTALNLFNTDRISKINWIDGYANNLASSTPIEAISLNQNASETGEIDIDINGASFYVNNPSQLINDKSSGVFITKVRFNRVEIYNINTSPVSFPIFNDTTNKQILGQIDIKNTSSGGVEIPTYNTKLTSAQTDITISNLDINTDLGYHIVVNLYNPLGTSIYPRIYFNGDTTDTDYQEQYIQGLGATISGDSNNAPGIGAVVNGTSSLITIDVSLGADGYLHFIANVGVQVGTSVYYYVYHGSKTATVTNITSITIHSDQASGLGIGSSVVIERLRPG